MAQKSTMERFTTEASSCRAEQACSPTEWYHLMHRGFNKLPTTRATLLPTSQATTVVLGVEPIEEEEEQTSG